MDIKSFVNRITLIYGQADPKVHFIELAVNSGCPSSIFKLAIELCKDDGHKKYVTDLKNIFLGNEYTNTDLSYSVTEFIVENFDIPRNEHARIIRNINHLHVMRKNKTLSFSPDHYNSLKIIFSPIEELLPVVDIINHYIGVQEISYFKIWSLYTDLVDEINCWAIYKLLQQSHMFPVDDFLSVGQIKSKLWLINTVKRLDLDLGDTVVHAAWAGLLPYLFMATNHTYTPYRFLCVDIDETLVETAYALNKISARLDRFAFLAQDSTKFKYKNKYKVSGDRGIFDMDIKTVINTSCEHIENFEQWFSNIPDGCLVILQSNNFDDEEHEGGHFTVNSLEEFESSVNFKELKFKGTLALEKYNRYMLIGIK